jgi:hypothetical protein
MTRYCLLVFLLSLPLAAQVEIKQASDRIMVNIDGKPFTALFVTAEVNKPYLHPLRSASGRVVTRYFPMDLVEGERRDHPHHRGLWFSHGLVNGYDLWANERNEKGPKKGRIVLRKIFDLQSGKKSGVIAAFFEWRDTEGRVLLTELKRLTFYAEPNQRVIDSDSMLGAAEKVKFGDTKEGMFAIRVAPWLEEEANGAPATPKRTGHMVNAEGAQGEQGVWGKRSPWVDYSGEVDGEKLGIAILDHPENPHFPTYWQCRGYGLCAANPFGASEFEHDPTKDGSLTLDSSQNVRFRYRVIIHSGDARSAGIAAQWMEFSRTK